MDKVFTLACCGKSSYAMAYELELGDPTVRKELVEGNPVTFKLEDGTSVCLRMVEGLLLAESITPDGARGLEWYCQDQFVNGTDEKLTDNGFIKRIYLRARNKKLDELLGAFVE